MTAALEPAVKSLHLPVHDAYFTCPAPGIPSINSPDDAAESAAKCFPHLQPLVPHYDAFLIACYSHHPLVAQLKHECSALSAAATGGTGGEGARKYVTGIFEASVLASLSLIDESQGFGIVSTGKVWEKALTDAVKGFLGQEKGKRYVGTETTGLNATELHDLPAEEVREKMKQATKRLLKQGNHNVGAICLGCAGMVGLEEAVRQACVEELGDQAGKKVYIVDGVKAGVAQLVGNTRTAF
ncbi:uncharacterized protein AB675_3338 [Cyphellophora attinorum]|uniref:Hydantoin racemase n=1 Tax=Cyphellophora attinorum TaxID=1664694 RepID=A0A0N1H3H1_9EURO|nr:uncharacterized protein AB675_3338 [Phialophora attinorum]KPI39564.1 hypothetical protein AB675_3338 [Phialophora attinorum]